MQLFQFQPPRVKTRSEIMLEGGFKIFQNQRQGLPRCHTLRRSYSTHFESIFASLGSLLALILPCYCFLSHGVTASSQLQAHITALYPDAKVAIPQNNWTKSRKPDHFGMNSDQIWLLHTKKFCSIEILDKWSFLQVYCLAHSDSWETLLFLLQVKEEHYDVSMLHIIKVRSECCLGASFP